MWKLFNVRHYTELECKEEMYFRAILLVARLRMKPKLRLTFSRANSTSFNRTDPMREHFYSDVFEIDKIEAAKCVRGYNV